MTAKTVLVTNGTGASGHVAAKSLALAGHRIVTVDFCRLPFGMRSRYSTLHRVVDGRSQPDFESELLEFVHRIRPDVFLPLGTRFVFFAAKYRDRFPPETAVNVPGLDAFMTAYIKSACMAECRGLGIPCPDEYTHEEATSVLEGGRVGTVVVKPDLDAGAATGVRFLHDGESLRGALRECSRAYGHTLIQEYIPGDADAMRTVVLLFSRASVLRAAFTTSKIRQWPIAGGQTAVSCSTDDCHLVDQVLPFFEKWRWRGAAEVELKFDRRDGRYKVVEINPRFPGYLRFPRQCGLDFALLAMELTLASGQSSPVAFPAYRTGAKYLNPGLFLRTVARGVERRGIAELRRAMADLRGTGSAFLDLLDDPFQLLGKTVTEFRSTPADQRLFYIAR